MNNTCKKQKKLSSNEWTLSKNNWANHTYHTLNQLILANGKTSENYNSDVKPYAVFDFDNTTVINDIQEATIIYQIENLCYKIKSEKMFDVLVTDIPDIHRFFVQGYENEAGEPLTTAMLVDDIVNDYQFLYQHFIGFENGGTLSLQQIHQTNEYLDFRAKLWFLYLAINATFGAVIAYTWVLYLFTGMTVAEVETIALKSMDYWSSYGIFTKKCWTSPKSHVGISGVVSVSYITAVSIPEEIKNLYQTLNHNGIDVYICSASLQELVQAIATNPKYGLNVPKNRVFAMRLKTDDHGIIINQRDERYVQTYAKGKVQTINQFIRPKYQDNDPILVAGDSGGDYNMMTEYSGLQVGLIINRVLSGSWYEISKIAADTICHVNAKFVLQGRDENQGQFRPSEKSILLGEHEEKLLCEPC